MKTWTKCRKFAVLFLTFSLLDLIIGFAGLALWSFEFVAGVFVIALILGIVFLVLDRWQVRGRNRIS